MVFYRSYSLLGYSQLLAENNWKVLLPMLLFFAMLQPAAAIPPSYYCYNCCFPSILLWGEVRFIFFLIHLHRGWQPRPGGTQNMRYRGLKNEKAACPLWNKRRWRVEWVASWNPFSILAGYRSCHQAHRGLGLGSRLLVQAACACSPKSWSSWRDMCSQKSPSTISRNPQLCHHYGEEQGTMSLL